MNTRADFIPHQTTILISHISTPIDNFVAILINSSGLELYILFESTLAFFDVFYPIELL